MDAQQAFRLLAVPPDGRCFFWVLLLHSLPDSKKNEWLTARRCNGWPVDAERKNEEDQSVVGFSKQIKFPDPLCYSDFFSLTRTAAALCK